MTGCTKLTGSDTSEHICEGARHMWCHTARPSWSCVRDEGVGLDGRSPTASKIEENGELVG
jgi:hypothetical protein